VQVRDVMIGSGVAAVHVTADVTDAVSSLDGFLQQIGADSHVVRYELCANAIVIKLSTERSVFHSVNNFNNKRSK